MLEAALKEAAQERQPWIHFHWQNLNDKKGGGKGLGLRHGRCWWHFRSRNRRPGPSIEFCWKLWSSFCRIGFDIDDDNLTLSIAFPPVALWLSFGTNFWLIDKLAPRKVLCPRYYPDTIVVDERECSIEIHSGRLWIHPWAKTMEHVRADPWWVRGVSFPLNPFEWKHQRHEVRCCGLFNNTKTDRLEIDRYWEPYVGSWERDAKPDHRQILVYPYRYVLKDGTVQERTARVFVERRAWRPRCLQWTSLFEKVSTSIDVQFSDEVGERSGSWKGGCTGCGWELRDGETPEQALRRMERDRKF